MGAMLVQPLWKSLASSKAKTQAPCQRDAPTSPLCRFSKEMRACSPQTIYFCFTHSSQNNRNNPTSTSI